MWSRAPGACSRTSAATCGQRLDRPDLVVDPHHRHERGLLVERGREIVEVDEPVRRDPGFGHAEALGLEPVRGREHALVLEGGGDHAVEAVDPPGGTGTALDREVVGLGPPAGEHDLVRSTAEHGGDGLPGLLERGLGCPGRGVAARRVARVVGEERQHRHDRLRPHRRARRVIEVGE